VLGGAKVADKLSVIDNLLKVADTLVIGGGMAYTFLKAKGYEVGTRCWTPSPRSRPAGATWSRPRPQGKQILLPVDVRVARRHGLRGRTVIGEVDVVSDEIPAGKMGLDIGPETERCTPTPSRAPRPSSGTARWACSRSRPSPKGTKAVAQGAHRGPTAFSVVGGGDSAAAVRVTSASPTTSSATSRPAAARRWSTWRARNCPGLAVLEGGQLMTRTPIMAGNWKMNLNHVEAAGLVEKLAWTLATTSTTRASPRRW
jgi:phosphoglycerate kinase